VILLLEPPHDKSGLSPDESPDACAGEAEENGELQTGAFGRTIASCAAACVARSRIDYRMSRHAHRDADQASDQQSLPPAGSPVLILLPRVDKCGR
jgi:hypothetical protein